MPGPASPFVPSAVGDELFVLALPPQAPRVARRSVLIEKRRDKRVVMRPVKSNERARDGCVRFPALGHRARQRTVYAWERARDDARAARPLSYFLPLVSLKSARRFFAQHASSCSVQSGFSLP